MRDAYEIILGHHVRNMVGDMLTTQNTHSLMQGGITKELEAAKKKTFETFGEGIGQSSAFLLAVDTFKTTELAKFCLVLSMSRLGPATQALEVIGAKEETLLIDGAERMAQILQNGFNEDAKEYLAKTLNVKNALFSEIKTSLAQARES